MTIEELTAALSQIITVARIDLTWKSLPEEKTSAQWFIGENGIFHSDCTMA